MPASAKSPRRRAEFFEGPAPSGGPTRKPYAGDDLVGSERCLERADEEIGGGDRAGARHADDIDRGVRRRGDARQLGGGIGMRETAADRAAIANLIMADMLDRGGEKRQGRGEPRVGFDVAPADPRAEMHMIGLDGDAIETGNAREVDEHARRRQAKSHQRHETLAAGQRPRRTRGGGENLRRLGERCRRLVVERRQLHVHPCRRMPRAPTLAAPAPLTIVFRSRARAIG